MIRHKHNYSDVLGFSGTSDHFVNVTFDIASSAIICIFHGLMGGGNSVHKTCSIMYGTNKACGLSTLHSACGRQHAENVSNAVIVGLPLLQTDTVYYYVVTASNGTYRALIQGKVSKGVTCIVIHEPTLSS